MYELNKSLPNMKVNIKQEIEKKSCTDNDSENSFDLRSYLTKKSEKLKRRRNSIDLPIGKRRRVTYDSPSASVPMFKNFQLLGDSQFVRFSEQLLSYSNSVSYTEDTYSRRIGYCVSGQKIKDLKERLVTEEFSIHSQVMMLIGTNDLVYHTSLDNMIKYYAKIVAMLKQKCSKIILLTIPPVPRLEDNQKHWYMLKCFNKFIEEFADDNQVYVVDLCSVFISYDNSISRDYFESVFNTGPRPDLIHLNRKGFQMLKTIIDINLVD